MGRMRVSLLTTCLTDTFFPGAGAAAVRLLERLGCTVEAPAGQTCCGQPQFNNGLHAAARRLARRLVEVFADSPCVVCPSASCTALIRDYYEWLFADEPGQLPQVRALIRKTYELTEFLTRVLRVDWSSLGLHGSGKVTYHYSCRSRGIGVGPEATVELIGKIRGVEYVPAGKLDQCCGFGGTFAVKLPEVSEALAADKAACLAATGAETVVVNDGGCALNLMGYCHRHGIRLRFVHVGQLLAEALGPTGGAVNGVLV